MSIKSQLLRIQHDGKRAVICQADLHGCAKAACLDIFTLLTAGLYNIIVQRLGMVWAAGSDEGWSVALTAVRIQGELGNQQQAAAHILQGKVCLALFIPEDP